MAEDVAEQSMTQTAMLLTDREWDDLAEICDLYCVSRAGADEDESVQRRVALARRIMEAN